MLDMRGMERGLRSSLRKIPANRTGATGLEPATSGVTGRRSNQLNYAPGRTNLSRVARPPDAGLYEVSPGAGSGAAGRPAPADGRPIPS